MSHENFNQMLAERLLSDVKNKKMNKTKALKVFREKSSSSLSESLTYLKTLCYSYLHCAWEDLK